MDRMESLINKNTGFIDIRHFQVQSLNNDTPIRLFFINKSNWNIYQDLINETHNYECNENRLETLSYDDLEYLNNNNHFAKEDHTYIDILNERLLIDKQHFKQFMNDWICPKRNFDLRGLLMINMGFDNQLVQKNNCKNIDMKELFYKNNDYLVNHPDDTKYYGNMIIVLSEHMLNQVNQFFRINDNHIPYLSYNI